MITKNEAEKLIEEQQAEIVRLRAKNAELEAELLQIKKSLKATE